MFEYDYFSASFKGRRENNEDLHLELLLDDNLYFFGVADGMGGVEGGEIASKIVLDYAKAFLEAEFKDKNSNKDLKKSLEDLFTGAQQVVREEKTKNPSLQGMGTTLTCILIHKSSYVVGNIGDSRTYIIKNGKLDQISTDHSYIQEMIDELSTEPDPALVQRYGNYITRVIDGGNDKPDIFPRDEPTGTLESGDVFLLCSDGLLYDKIKIDDNKIINSLLGTKDLRTATEQLISDAFNNGSTDNITLTLFAYGAIPRKQVNLKLKPYPPTDIPVKEKLNKLPIPISSNKISIGLIGLIIIALVFLVIQTNMFKIGCFDRSEDTKSTIKKQTKVEKVQHDDSTSSRIPAKETKVILYSEWKPFEGDLLTYKVDERFTWSEYQPVDSISYYRVTFNDGNPLKTNMIFCDLKNVKGLKRDTTNKVKLEVILKNETVIEHEILIKIN